MEKKNITLMVISVVTLLSFVLLATYAYFTGTVNVINKANVTASTERNNMVFDTVGGSIQMNITATSMQKSQIGLAGENNTTLTVNFQANTSYSMVCTYDIIYEWTSNSSNRYTTHSNGVTGNEFTIQASLASNAHVYEGTNNISSETDLSVAVGNQASATVVSGAKIDATGTATSSAVWTLTSRFYNVNADQSGVASKNYQGRFKVANVSCVSGNINASEFASGTLVSYLVNNAPKSGTDAVSNSPWILTSDHDGELRYAGKNPNNYIRFNNELWRIIGVMPNMEYCTGIYNDSVCSETATGSLVKIIKNDSEGQMAWDDGSYYAYNTDSHNNGLTLLNNKYGDIAAPIDEAPGANDWTKASLKTYLNGLSYATDTHIAVVNWSLYGLYNYQNDTPAMAFSDERNLNGHGYVSFNYPTYWYGKIGLMYPSDFGYATNGDEVNNRAGCLSSAFYQWYKENDKQHCSANSYLWYLSVENSIPSNVDYHQWTIIPFMDGTDDYVSIISYWGSATSAMINNSLDARPALYLKPDTLISGNHTGTWNDPYEIQ